MTAKSNSFPSLYGRISEMLAAIFIWDDQSKNEGFAARLRHIDRGATIWER
jgi:hypothetical protein